MFVKCYSCNKTIKLSPSAVREKNFCNHKCYADYKAKTFSGKNNPRWRGGEDEKRCLYCGSWFRRKKYGKQSRNKYCSLQCAAKHRGLKNREENHWAWKGGCDIKTTAKIRRTWKYKEWQDNILKRDDYTCQECGKRGGDLHIHHTIRLYDLMRRYFQNHLTINVYDDFFYNPENGITLCVNCHRQTFKIETSGELLKSPSG